MKGAKRTIRGVRFLGIYFLLILAAAVFMFSPVARAAPLNLVPMPPDITAGFIDVTYSAGTDLLSASGFSATLDGNNLDTSDGVYSIDATIDETGALLSGTVSIEGTYAASGFNSGTLLTGDLTDLGFPLPGNGDTLEFLFDVTGGDAAGLYGPEGGIILSFSGFGDSFASDFDNLMMGFPGTGNGVSNNFLVIPNGSIPIPGAVWLLASGFMGLAGLRRKFRR
jgi:hypothetical protein